MHMSRLPEHSSSALIVPLMFAMDVIRWVGTFP